MQFLVVKKWKAAFFLVKKRSFLMDESYLKLHSSFLFSPVEKVSALENQLPWSGPLWTTIAPELPVKNRKY